MKDLDNEELNFISGGVIAESLENGYTVYVGKNEGSFFFMDNRYAIMLTENHNEIVCTGRRPGFITSETEFQIGHIHVVRENLPDGVLLHITI